MVGALSDGNRKKSEFQAMVNVWLVIFLILAMIQVIPFEDSIVEEAAASSSWTQSSNTEFKNGELNNVVVTANGDVKLTTQTVFVKDDFDDESNIGFKKNVAVNTTLGEAKLAIMNKTFGGASSEHGYSGYYTSDGGYVLAGCTASYGSGAYDGWLIKMDAVGEVEWERIFGGWGNDLFRTVMETSDGGYIMAGWADSWGAGMGDVWLLKTDSLGNKLWDKTFGGSDHEDSSEVLETSDGGYIVVGYTRSNSWGWSDAYVVKTDSSGNEQWSKRYGGNDSDYGDSIQQTSDGGYMIGAVTSSYSNSWIGIWLVKIDANGNEQWNKTFNCPDGVQGGFVKKTSDGGFIISGTTESYGAGADDIWLIKTDSSGNEQWNRTYGGPKDDGCRLTQQASDGGYIIVGRTRSYSQDFGDIWLVKTDGFGVEQWNESYDLGSYDIPSYVQETIDGGYMVTGTESYDMDNDNIFFFKTDRIGNIQYETGELISTNLLTEHNATSFDILTYETSIPTGTNIKIQFSKDNLSWYNSSGLLNKWDELEDGLDYFNLSSLNWHGGNFYYKINFTSDNLEIPSIQRINLYYTSYFSAGTLESESLDSGGIVNWTSLSWSSTEPPGTEIKFKVRTASDKSSISSKKFLGPDGTTATFYTTPGESIWSGHEGDRWIEYKAYFSTFDTSTTPILHDVTLEYNFLPERPLLDQSMNDTWQNIDKPTFAWTFNDTDSSSQGGFQWQLDDSKYFDSIDFDSGKILSSSTYFTPTFKIPDGIWYWRVKTHDIEGAWGPYSGYSIVKVDTSILPPQELSVSPGVWTSENSFTIDWTYPKDLSGIKRGIYYYIGTSEPTSDSDGTWITNKPFTIADAPEGENNIYLWLEDKVGNIGYLNYSNSTLKLDTIAPEIEHTKVTTCIEGSAIPITAMITDECCGVEEVTLYYKQSSASKFSKIPMVLSDEVYAAEISEDFVTNENLIYYLEAVDNSKPSNTIYYGSAGETEVKPTATTGIEIEISLRPIIVENSPTGKDVSVNTTINVTFSKSMDKPETEIAFSISPKTTGKISWQDEKMIFTPDTILKHNTEYTVTISEDAKDIEDINIAKEFQWSFTTEKKVEIEDKPESEKDGEEIDREYQVKIYGMASFIVVLIIIFLILLLLYLKKEKPPESPPEQPEGASRQTAPVDSGKPPEGVSTEVTDPTNGQRQQEPPNDMLL